MSKTIDIRAERKAKGLTIEALAAATGYSVKTLGMVERTPVLISPGVAAALAKALELDVERLLALAEQRRRVSAF